MMLGKVKPPPKVVTWTGNAFDVNLRATFNAWYGATINPEDTIVLVINPGVYIGASSTGAWALQPGGWGDLPASATLTLIIQGRIQGAGGQGGGANSNGALSFDEWAAKTIGKFQGADKDRSGWLTPAEYALTAPPPPKHPTCSCRRTTSEVASND